MCGRFTLTTNELDLEGRFGFFNPQGILFEPRYNIAPSQEHPIVIVEEDRRVVKLMKWGLVPQWSKDPEIGYKMINARSEGIEEKPSFRTPLRKRRCLVIANGFYEWKTTAKKTKMPYLFTLTSGEPFAFAGLWDQWKKRGETLTTFTIITTEPNEIVEPIHNRMPVILRKKDENRWLDPEITYAKEVLPLLKPYPTDDMLCARVSVKVNSPKNDTPDCIVPIRQPG